MVSSLEFSPQVAANTSNLSINHFARAADDGSLTLRPSFQRNLVWNAEQRAFLVDSVLRGLPVPEVYIQTVTTADGSEDLVVVDGQQRISTCLQFIQGDLRLPLSEDYDARWRGRVFGELIPELQQRFRAFKLVVRDLPTLGDNGLREVFRRLNQTVEPLEPQELRHAAYTGGFIRFVEAAASSPVLNDLGVFSARDYVRRRNDELVAEIAYALLQDAFPNKKEGLDQLFKTADVQGLGAGQLEELRARFGRTLMQLEPLVARLRRTRFRNKSDFYSLCVYLGREAHRLPMEPTAESALLDALVQFSAEVNEIKQLESDTDFDDVAPASPFTRSASVYLRAVERAASDRLNRVRRQESLAAVLGPIVAAGPVKPFTASDSSREFGPLEEGDLEDSTAVEESERVLLGES